MRSSRGKYHEQELHAYGVSGVGFLAFLGCVWVLGAPPARGQVPPEDDPWVGIEELVVTGNAQSTVLTQSTISVEGFDDTDLEAIGATNVAGLADFTPNLEIKSAFGASNPTIFIRGVGLDDARANASSSVAVLYDDVYMNSPAGQLAQMFDTRKVDVLRGPQGTFFGRNATAGAIRIISNEPSGELGASLNVTYGRFDHREIEGMIETPIIPDILSVRFAGRFYRRDGYLENRCASLDAQTQQNRFLTRCSPTVIARGPPPERWLNNADNWAARAVIRLKPPGTDAFEALLNVHGSRSRGLSTQFQTIGIGGPASNPITGTAYSDPDNCTEIRLVNNRRRCFASLSRPEQGDPYAGDYFRTATEKLDLFGVSLKLNGAFGDVTVKSISAYEWHDRADQLNLDAAPDIALEPLFTDKAYQFTQELELGWDSGDGLSLTLGAFFLYERLLVFNIFFAGGNFSPLQDQTQRTRYVGAFGHASWAVTEDFTIEGGARLNYERKTFAITSSTWNSFTGSSVESNDLDDSTEAEEIALGGELTAEYSPTESISFYGKYTRAWKGPHFNGAAVRSVEAIIEPAKPESVDAFEFGIKSRSFNEAITLDVAAFYYNYKNQQVFQNRSITDNIIVNELINANDTRVAGVEASFRSVDVVPLAPWLEVVGLSSSFSFSYLYSEYTDFVNIDTKLVTDPRNPVPIAISEVSNFSGNQLVSAPEISLTGDLSYRWETSRFGTFTPRIDYTWRSKVYFTPDNEARLGDRPRWLLNARLGWQIYDDRIEVAGWVRNLTGETYRLTALDLIGVLDQINYVINPPRTYGLSVSLRY